MIGEVLHFLVFAGFSSGKSEEFQCKGSIPSASIANSDEVDILELELELKPRATAASWSLENASRSCYWLDTLLAGAVTASPCRCR